MQPITNEAIHKMADTLAAGMLADGPEALWGQPPDESAKAGLAGWLAPGVAAFVGTLMTLAYDQEDVLAPSVERFFADPATAKALVRYLEGDAAAAQTLRDLALEAGLRDSAPLYTYFDSAVEILVEALVAAAYRSQQIPNAMTLFSREEMPHAADNYGMSAFVEAYYATGLDHIELGLAVASDGSVIYVWPPVPMTGELEEVAESAGPDVPRNGNGGHDGPEETTSGVEPPSKPPPGEPPPQPRPQPEDKVVDLRLDAALPDRVTVGRAFDLAVAIRRPDSPVEAPEDLARRESADFSAVMPADAPFVQFQVQVSAPDCDIQGGDTRAVRLYDGKDCPLVYFLITPRIAGTLSIIITVYQEMDWIGSTRLRTEATLMEPRVGMSVAVNSQPVGNGEVNLGRLRTALDDGYSDNELRDLCFELNIDYEDLPGDNQSAKARELVLYAKRRDRIADLVRLVMRDRPHLLVAP